MNGKMKAGSVLLACTGLLLGGTLTGVAHAESADSGPRSGVVVKGADQKDPVGKLLSGLVRNVATVECPDGGYVSGASFTGLPDGLSKYDGQRTNHTSVTGTPAKPGTYQVKVEATCMNRDGKTTGSGEFTWVVEGEGGDAGITLNAFNQHHKVGQAVNNLNPVTGTCRKNSDSPTPKFSLEGLPPGIEANDKGQAWGQPSKAGVYVVKVHAHCNETDGAHASFVWTVDEEADVPMSSASTALAATGALGVMALLGGAYIHRRKRGDQLA